jgi:glycosyltransferase involved in cell wall biosynthesis
MPARDTLVSVIIPACNAGKYISETLDSARTQTHAALEIVVVDDGSTDQTPGIVEQAARLDERIVLLRQQRRGVAAARNRGIEHARGEWIAPLDADDAWYPEKIEKQLRAAALDGKRAGLVYAWTQVTSEEGVPLFQMRSDWQGDAFLPLVMCNIVGHGSCPLIHRSCFEDVGGYDTTFFPRDAQGCEDWDLYLRVARKHCFAVAREILVRYRMATDSMSMRHHAMERSYRFMRSNLLAAVPGLPRRLVEWSESAFYIRMASSARKSGDFGHGLRCLMRSCASNPLRLQQAATYRLLAALLLRRLPRSSQTGPLPPSDLSAGNRQRIYDWRQKRIIAEAESWWNKSAGRPVV